MSDFLIWAEEPTRLTGHRRAWPAGSNSYVLTTPDDSRATGAEHRRLARAAMAWAFKVLPGEVRVCDCFLLDRASSAPNLTLYPHQHTGLSVAASDPSALADWIYENSLHDDCLFLRPMGVADTPDLQPWLKRDEAAYVVHGIPRYGAVVVFSLRPISLEVISAAPIESWLHNAKQFAAKSGVTLERDPSPEDRNWPGWAAWFKKRLSGS